MKNSFLLIVGVIAVAAVLIPVFYYPSSDHFKYQIPIKNSEIHINTIQNKSIPFERINDSFSRELMHFTLLDNQTIKIDFRIPEEILSYPINDFEDFEREFTIGDNLVVSCQEGSNTSRLVIYQFKEIRQVNEKYFVDYIDVEASSKVFLSCDYPQIVDYSTNVFDFR